MFPVFSSLQVKTNEQYKKVSLNALALTAVIYTTVGLICLYMFGTEIKSSVLLNVGSYHPGGIYFWQAYVTQVSFMIVLMCHIPFIFYAGKEGLLIIIDELDRKSISSALWHKLNANGPRTSKALDSELPPNPMLPIPGDADKTPYCGFTNLEN